ncbi:MAG: hypothetical protein GXY01_04320 [Clostridiales bacterium]|jgi:hypothetical protein|nr:hypothetical protein [Clostridiales bacterium]
MCFGAENAIATNDMIEKNITTEPVIIDSTGNVLSFSCLEQNGKVRLYYYFNGQLGTIYDLPIGGSTITATRVNGKQSYILEKPQSLSVKEPVFESSREEITPMSYIYVGSVNYNFSPKLACSPYCQVNNETVSSSKSYIQNCYAGSPAANVVATISSTLIDYGLSTTVSPSAAASILTAMIGYCGGEIVNGLLSKAFQDTYYCRTASTTTQTRMNGSNINTITGIYYGFEKWATCHGYSGDKSEYTSSGITPRNWYSASSAQTYWTGAFSNTPFPGVSYVG